MEVEPHDDITTFLLHIRRSAADKTTSSSHDVTVSSADVDKATATSAIDTGDVDTEGGASAPPADMAIGNTNNPIGLDGTILMGPSDDTHVVNAAAPAGASQPPSPTNTGMDIGAVTTSSVTAACKRKGRGKGNHVAQDELAWISAQLLHPPSLPHANGRGAVKATTWPRMNTSVNVGRLSSSPRRATRRLAHNPQGRLATRQGTRGERGGRQRCS